MGKRTQAAMTEFAVGEGKPSRSRAAEKEAVGQLCVRLLRAEAALSDPGGTHGTCHQIVKSSPSAAEEASRSRPTLPIGQRFAAGLIQSGRLICRSSGLLSMSERSERIRLVDRSRRSSSRRRTRPVTRREARDATEELVAQATRAVQAAARGWQGFRSCRRSQPRRGAQANQLRI
jgi:hypothetical protein